MRIIDVLLGEHGVFPALQERLAAPLLARLTDQWAERRGVMLQAPSGASSTR